MPETDIAVSRRICHARIVHRVVIADGWVPSTELEAGQLTGIATVERLGAKSSGELRGRLTDAAGVILYHEVAIDASLIAEMTRCRAIVRCGAGVDNVDTQAAGERGIVVCNIPDYGIDEVADHALGLALACNRGLMLIERGIRRSLTPWDMRAVEPVFRLSGATFGIVGLGNIGSAVARRAQGLGLRVVAHDPFAPVGRDKVLGVPLLPLNRLLEQSDFVSLHTPLTDETRRLIDAEALGHMKKTAILINTSRGPVVDADALVAALLSRSIAGAGIDVLDQEPASEDSKLVRLWQEDRQPPLNLILTPHTAWYSVEAIDELRSKSGAEMARILRGERPLNVVNNPYLKLRG